ncbi:hypothetical protein ACJMK2_043842 [Sinanodonta woodiana]|uniref:Uncharacterized protein n=1 Tax=Sinanodonta woodiana TaxID=1069815 RepID=A0ABD3VY61_SINWO
MKLHKIKYSGYGEILFRDVSCVCSEGYYHTEHQMKLHCLIDGIAETNSYSKTPNDTFQNETETKHEKTLEKLFVSEMLVELGQCQTFSDIKVKCVLTLMKTLYLLCPSDMQKDTTLYHVMITADGNCLT